MLLTLDDIIIYIMAGFNIWLNHRIYNIMIRILFTRTVYIPDQSEKHSNIIINIIIPSEYTIDNIL